MNCCYSKTSLTLRLKRPGFEVFAIAYLSVGYITHIFNLTVRHFVGNTHKLDTLFIYAVLMLLLVMAIRETINRVKAWQILGLLVEIVVLVLFMLTSSDSETHSIVLNEVLTGCVPMFLCGACIYDYSKMRYGLIRVMTVVPYCYLLMMIFLGLNMLDVTEAYSQTDSYAMLLASVVLTSALLEHFSIKYMIPLGISMFFMVAYGARGPLVCWILFFALQMMTRLSRENLLKKISVITAFSIVGIIVYHSYNNILLRLRTIFSQLHFSVRVIDMMLNYSFLTDRSRNSIASLCLERIWKNPLIGTGPVNDRIYIASQLGRGESAVGNYPHNIFLEFLLQYGVIIGGVFLLLIVWVLIKSYRVAPDAASKDFILILIGTYLFPLFFSRSYLDSSGFYFLIAVCITAVIHQQKARSTIQGAHSCENSQILYSKTMESST